MKIEAFDGVECDNFTPSSLKDAIATATAILERRRHLRVELQLPGRYMLEDLSEHACETIDVSPGGLRLKAPEVLPWGARVVAYIEGLGRVEGLVVRRARGWFALSLRTLPVKEERLASKIDWLVQKSVEGAPDRRQNTRLEGDDEYVVVRTEDGREHLGELIDISVEGAAFLLDAELRLDQTIRVGSHVAKVHRLFKGGAAVAFI